LLCKFGSWHSQTSSLSMEWAFLFPVRCGISLAIYADFSATAATPILGRDREPPMSRETMERRTTCVHLRSCVQDTYEVMKMQWNWIGVVATVVGLSVPVQVAAPPHMALPIIQEELHAQSGRIVTWLSLVSTNGVKTEPIPVEVDSYSASFYRWSPTGRTLVFGKAHDLYIYDKKTEKLTNTQHRWEMKPSWSPKGDSVAFLSRPLDPSEGRPAKPGADPWVMRGCDCGSPTVARPDGTGYRVLENVPATNPPTWSPDSSMLAYDANGEIHVYNLKLDQITRLRPGDFGLRAKYLSAPSWSPIRRELAVSFSEDAQSPTREQVLSKTAPRPRQGYAILDLAHNTARIVYQYVAPFVPRPPALWSSDGDRIALVFTAALIVHEPLGLVVFDRASSGVEVLAKHPYLAAWEPGGRRLAFVDADNSRQVGVLTPTPTGWATQRIEHRQFVEGLAWRPAQRRSGVTPLSLLTQ